MRDRPLASAAALVAAAALAGCAPTLSPERFADTRPAVDPFVIFAGRTASQGVLEAASGAPSERFRVQGTGRVEPDGTLVLDQRIAFEGKPARERTWRLRRLDAHHFTASLTDASGPVSAEAYGALLHLRFRLKGVPLGAMEQWLYLQDDGRTLVNEAVVRVAGVPVRRLSERITNLDLPPAPPATR
ncbi:MAG: DUF3833 family protein [Caulobacteraceae bacterium]|nr:DUF3833 family protein [Caulobacter sp.]